MDDLLSIDAVPSNGTTTIAVAGEIDFASKPRITAALLDAVHSCPHVIVDLERVTYLDSLGVPALMTAREEALNRGGSLTIKRPNKNVRMVLAVAGVLSLLMDESEAEDGGVTTTEPFESVEPPH